MSPVQEEIFHSLQKSLSRLLHLSMRGLWRFAKAEGISLPQLFTLRQIHYQGECNISSIGEQLGVSNAAASQMLDKLVQMGWGQRMEDAQDRRIKRIELTDQGRKLMNASNQAHQLWIIELSKQLNEEEARLLQQGLEILLEKSAVLLSENPENS